MPAALSGRSVETYWSPLTPEHGFPSLTVCATRHKALPFCRAALQRADPLWSSTSPNNERKRTCRRARPLFQHLSLRWHYPNQVNGSERSSSLSACLQAPRYIQLSLDSRASAAGGPVRFPALHYTSAGRLCQGYAAQAWGPSGPPSTGSSHSIWPAGAGMSMHRCWNQLSCAAPCQCFSSPWMHTTSPGWSSRAGRPHA